MHPQQGPAEWEMEEFHLLCFFFLFAFFWIDHFLKNSTAQDSTTHPKCVAIYILRKLYSNHM